MIAYAYDGQVYTDLGLRLVAPVEAFEVWSSRATYDDPIVSEWHPETGPAVQLPAGSMEDFNGLKDFLTIEVHKASDGSLVRTGSRTSVSTGTASGSARTRRRARPTRGAARGTPTPSVR